MKLSKQITVQPPKYTDNASNKVVTPQPIVTDTLSLIYSDNPSAKTYYVHVDKFPNSVVLWKGPDYDNAGLVTRLDAEKRFREIMGDDEQKYLQSLFPMTLEENPDGPGSILTGMISTLGIKSTSNCSCRRHALEMNEKGPDWCEQNLDTIIGWLKDESKKRNLPFVETVAKMMVNKAISKSRKLLARNSKQ